MTAAEAKARGVAHFRKKEYDQAIAEFTTAIELEPDNHAFYSNRSAVHAAKEDFENALVDGQKCIEVNPTWAKGYGRVGYALFKLDKADEAKQMYEEGLKHDPENKSLKQGLKDCQGSQQNAMNAQIWMKILADPQLAEMAKDERFRQKVNILLQNPQMAMQMGLMQDPQMALVFERAFGIKGFGSAAGAGDGDDDDSPMNSSSARSNPYDAKSPEEPEPVPEPEPEPEPELTEEERKEREEERLAKEAELQRKAEAEALKKRGNEFYANKNFDEAIAEYKKAQELNTTQASYILNESAVLFMQKKWDECLECCQRAIQVCQESFGDLKWTFKAYQRMGSVEERRGDVEQAIKYYQSALVEKSDDKLRRHIQKLTQKQAKAEAKALLDPELAEQRKQEGNELFKNGNFRGAIAKFEEASKRNPDDYTIFSNLSNAYCKVMSWEAAMAACDTCLKLNPTFVKALIRKGKVLHALKQYHKALTCFEEAEKLDASSVDLMEAKGQTLMAIQQRNASGEVDEQARARALQDPEIQAAINDPEVSQVLMRAQSGDPGFLMKAMRDRPHIAEKIQKLVAAGILRVG